MSDRGVITGNKYADLIIAVGLFLLLLVLVWGEWRR